MTRAFVRRLLGMGTRTLRPPRRLSEAEALQIAATHIAGPLFVREVKLVGERVEWTVGSATVGRGTMARIDAATGKVLEVRRWGVR